MLKAILMDYTGTVLLEPDVPFVQDGDRSPVIQKDRQTYSDQIRTLLDRHQKSYLCIKGSYQSRFTQAVEAVNQMLRAGPSL